MRLEFYPADKLRSEIAAIVSERLDPSSHRVFFFGSRVSGTGTERSDVDVGIEGPAPVPAAVLAEIEEAVDSLPTLYKIDIVDFRRLSDKFRIVALEHTERIA